jgi:hypothetical protein
MTMRCRGRLYRILSHCFFHHRVVFDAVERASRLCLRFVTFGLRPRARPARARAAPRRAAQCVWLGGGFRIRHGLCGTVQ